MKTVESIYFISYESGPIKIGKAIDVRKRLSGLQTSHHNQLQVLGVVSGKLFSESQLHRKFDHLRIRGEWFRRHEDLIQFIAENRDERLFGKYAPLAEWQVLDPEKHGYGVVQVIDQDSEHFEKFGFWDDDHHELIEECAYCVGARKRGLPEDDDCPDCVYGHYAIVYLDEWAEGYELFHHEELRILDDELEHKTCMEVVRRLFPKYNDGAIERIVDTGEPMAPIWDAQMWVRDISKVMERHFNG